MTNFPLERGIGVADMEQYNVIVISVKYSNSQILGPKESLLKTPKLMLRSLKYYQQPKSPLKETIVK